MYVATPQGYRRKIGPKSRYGTTPDEPAYQRTPQRVGSERQRVGTSNSGLDARFGSSDLRVRKELDEREKADRFLFDREKQRSEEARKKEDAAKATEAASSATRMMAAGASNGPMGAGIQGVLESLRTSSERVARQREAAKGRARGRAKALAER